MNGTPRAKADKAQLPPAAVASSFGGMVSDLLELGELQLKLLKRDTTETISRTYIAVGLVVVGLITLFACLPIGMLAIAQVLHESAELSMVMSYTIVVGLGLILSGLLVLIGYFKLKRVGNVFRRSESEFSENVKWLKASLKQGKSTN